MSKLGSQSFTPLNSVTLVCFDGRFALIFSGNGFDEIAFDCNVVVC